MHWSLSWLLHGIGIALTICGLVGVALPVIPGAPILFAGIVAIAWADGFTRIGWLGVTAAGGLAVLIVVVDYLAGVLGAKRFGGSVWGLVGAFVGLLAVLPFGPAGLVFGPIVGAVVLEYLKEPDVKRAGRVGLGTLVGFVIGTAVKYALACLMVGLAAFLYFY